MRSPIVILGGMGPQASLRFHQLLIRKSENYHSGNGDEYPYVIHFSLPVTDFISDERAKQDAIRTLRRLEPAILALEPKLITLACNTAHLLRPDVPVLQRPEFASMPQLVTKKVKADQLSRVGLLASPVTIRSKLYGHLLKENGIAVVTPNKKDINRLEQVIRAVIAGTAGKAEAIVLRVIADSLVAQGAQAIVLGCTELPLIFPKTTLPVPIYDTLVIYAQAIIDNYYSV